ncbi:ATP-binding protein [Sphaerotilus sp.]|uniref:ATP-binding protein n=1 Tax=Sphaerotilus sp. TaxID=2093942 RepID=UPI002ACE3E02|nr:ATP-binding protein [Sphaerotilus sp.]MDZ7858121.1 ATP-binding protein [Sphaerotilus sp.]
MDTAFLPRRKLPIGLQTLRELREDGYYYVDKTGMACDLVASGKAFFLSRPRRFGKSVFVDTLKELFEANRALFAGLAAEARWNWSQRHPVIRIDFGQGEVHSRAELDQRLHELLDAHARRLGITFHAQSISGRFAELISEATRLAGQRTVVLIDEYDKPILDNLADREVATAMRDGLRSFYSVLKSADADLKFVFLTGVSKFSKVSLFSGLNHLQDITVDPAWSALCGYTDEDVDTVFAPELPGLDREQIRRWYNGYNWRGTSVYNPFDLLLLFKKREFQPYWFQTGTPTFLVALLAERQLFTPDLSRLHSSESLLSSFDVGQISPEALLFQTGYLTIHGVSEPVPGKWLYRLGYPNREVETSLNEALLPALGVPAEVVVPSQMRLIDLLKRGDLPALEGVLHTLFASIPHDWYRNNPLARFEGHYASVFYSHFAALGLDLRLEDSTNHGRIDMALLFHGQVFVFEFKVIDGLNATGEALRQIEATGYADKYLSRGEPVHLVGIEFSRAARNVVGFSARTIPLHSRA